MSAVAWPPARRPGSGAPVAPPAPLHQGRPVELVALPGRDGTEQHRGQLRFAERLADRHQHRLRHVHSVGWHLWDGSRWTRDPNGEAVRAAVQIVKTAYRDLPDLDRQGRQELLSDIHKCESNNGIEGLLQLAGNLLPLAVSVDQLDADPYLFNAKNGTLDLRTGELRGHNRLFGPERGGGDAPVRSA